MCTFSKWEAPQACLSRIFTKYHFQIVYILEMLQLSHLQMIPYFHIVSLMPYMPYSKGSRPSHSVISSISYIAMALLGHPISAQPGCCLLLKKVAFLNRSFFFSGYFYMEIFQWKCTRRASPGLVRLFQVEGPVSRDFDRRRYGRGGWIFWSMNPPWKKKIDNNENVLSSKHQFHRFNHHLSHLNTYFTIIFLQWPCVLGWW